VLDEGARSEPRETLPAEGLGGLDADLGLTGADHHGVAAAHRLPVPDDGIAKAALQERIDAAPEVLEPLALSERGVVGAHLEAVQDAGAPGGVDSRVAFTIKRVFVPRAVVQLGNAREQSLERALPRLGRGEHDHVFRLRC